MTDRYVRFDWAIKRLLRQKANFGVLEGFLTVFLGEEVKIVEILESEGNQQEENDKFNRVDIKARNSKGEIIIVEIQNTSEVFYLERILYGVAKAITEHISLGNSYGEVKKVYSISVLYFDLGNGSDYLYKGENHFYGIHTNDELKITAKQRDAIVRKAPEEIFPTYYLIRVNNFDEVAVSPMEEWMRYLKEGVISDDAKAPGLQEAREKLLYYQMTPAERYAYDEHINAVMIQHDVLGNARAEGLAEGRAAGHAAGHAAGLAEGRAEGHAEGLAEGRAARSVEIARQLKSMGVSVEQIVAATGLAADVVNGL